MKRISKVLCFIMAVTLLMSCIPAGFTASAEDYGWVGSWGTPAIESGVVLGDNLDTGLHLQDSIPVDSTIRSTFTPTLGGSQIRLKFSNLFGKKAITINEATVARTGATDDVIDTSTVAQITFNGGQKSVTIAAGSEIYSDPVPFNVKALEKLSVSMHFKKMTTIYTHGLYGAKTYMASSLGNRTRKADLTRAATRLDFTSGTITYNTIPFLTRADVYSPGSYSVVLLGDSTLTNDIYLYLAQKVHENGIHNIGFVMSGIIGNALLRNGTGLIGKVYGVSLLDRAQRDAFDVAGVKHVIVKIGINDVLHPMLKSSEGKLPMMTSNEIIEGYKQLSEQAPRERVQLHLATKTPYKGYERAFMGSKDLEWKQEGEDVLQEINSWVEVTAISKGYYDSYVSFDNLRDPNDNAKFIDHITTDGAHLSKYGQIAATDLIPEAAYGVTKELKDIADILKIDPYTPPADYVPTTKAPETTTKNNSNNDNQNNGGSPVVITPVTPTTTVNNGNVITPDQNTSQQTTTVPDANQIQVDNPVNTPNAQQPVDGNTTNSSAASKQIIGFAVLAAVAVAIIAIAVVMLLKMRTPSTDLTRGGSSRAKEKKRV